MSTKIKGLLFFVFLITQVAFAQTNQEDEASLIIHETDGIHIETKDSVYSINIRFRLQNRFEYLSDNNNIFDPEAANFLVRRLRLRSFGYLGRKSLTYQFQLGFARGDMDALSGNLPNLIRDAVVSYKFTPKFEVAFGQTKLPGNRQRVISSGEQQFTDRSISNATFNLDRDAGVFVYYKSGINQFKYNLIGSISTGQGRNLTNKDKGLAYTGKIEILPFGPFSLRGDYFEGDWARESTPKLSIAGAYSFNDEANRTQGTLGEQLSFNTDISTYFLDFIFKCQGWSLYGEYANRTASKTIRQLADSSYQYVYVGEGLNFQASYQTPNHFEVAGRFARVSPFKEISDRTKGYNNYTLVVNKYIKWHRVKLQTEITYQDVDDVERAGSLKDQWIYRIQFEVGI